ncbi:hypothetical protein GGF32_006580 [Allomyces javanicus]|nr:hypothetical protein GGF32_006580 [Allomyces javanicus]
MAGLNTSVEDPMFWLHHGHVDYVWYKRQYFNVQQFYYEYDGQHTPGGIGHVTLDTRHRCPTCKHQTASAT